MNISGVGAHGGTGRRKRHPLAKIKGGWTAQEDNLLISLVQEMGEGNWSPIARQLNKLQGKDESSGRIGKQCRERWNHHLRPDIKKDAWTLEEEELLVKAHRDLGNRWSDIAKHIPGRSENAVKNFWNASLRRRDVAEVHPSPLKLYMQAINAAQRKGNAAARMKGSTRASKAISPGGSRKRRACSSDEEEDTTTLEDTEECGDEEDEVSPTPTRTPQSSPAKKHSPRLHLRTRQQREAVDTSLVTVTNHLMDNDTAVVAHVDGSGSEGKCWGGINYCNSPDNNNAAAIDTVLAALANMGEGAPSTQQQAAAATRAAGLCQAPAYSNIVARMGSAEQHQAAWAAAACDHAPPSPLHASMHGVAGLPTPSIFTSGHPAPDCSPGSNVSATSTPHHHHLHANCMATPGHTQLTAPSPAAAPAEPGAAPGAAAAAAAAAMCAHMDSCQPSAAAAGTHPGWGGAAWPGASSAAPMSAPLQCWGAGPQFPHQGCMFPGGPNFNPNQHLSLHPNQQHQQHQQQQQQQQQEQEEEDLLALLNSIQGPAPCATPSPADLGLLLQCVQDEEEEEEEEEEDRGLDAASVGGVGGPDAYIQETVYPGSGVHPGSLKVEVPLELATGPVQCEGRGSSRQLSAELGTMHGLGMVLGQQQELQQQEQQQHAHGFAVDPFSRCSSHDSFQTVHRDPPLTPPKAAQMRVQPQQQLQQQQLGLGQWPNPSFDMGDNISPMEDTKVGLDTHCRLSGTNYPLAISHHHHQTQHPPMQHHQHPPFQQHHHHQQAGGPSSLWDLPAGGAGCGESVGYGALDSSLPVSLPLPLEQCLEWDGQLGCGAMPAMQQGVPPNRVSWIPPQLGGVTAAVAPGVNFDVNFGVNGCGDTGGDADVAGMGASPPPPPPPPMRWVESVRDAAVGNKHVALVTTEPLPSSLNELLEAHAPHMMDQEERPVGDPAAQVWGHAGGSGEVRGRGHSSLLGGYGPLRVSLPDLDTALARLGNAGDGAGGSGCGGCVQRTPGDNVQVVCDMAGVVAHHCAEVATHTAGVTGVFVAVRVGADIGQDQLSVVLYVLADNEASSNQAVQKVQQKLAPLVCH